MNLTLLLLAILAVAAMLAYNHWQDRRNRRRADSLLVRHGGKAHDLSPAPVPDDRGDAAAPAAKDGAAREADFEAEIRLDTDWDHGQEVPDLPGLNLDSDIHNTVPASIPEPVPPADPETPLDTEIEQIARIRLTRPCVPALRNLVERIRAVGRPVRARCHAPETGWSDFPAGLTDDCVRVDIGLLLADRNGATSEEQLDDFARLLYRFGADQGAVVTCPDAREAATRAIDLDRFCIGVDVVIGLNVVAPRGQPFSGEAVHRLASEAGLEYRSGGYYALTDGAGNTLFTLVNQEDGPIPAQGSGLKTHGVRLLFDLPRVADCGAVFDRMAGLAERLADNLLATLVDDMGRPLSAGSLHVQREKLMDLYRRMMAREIPPGGERARRLFA